MANAVRSISEQHIFVDDTLPHATDLAHIRRRESIVALATLGIQQRQQEYTAFPDTKLVKYLFPLALRIAQHAVRHGIHHYFTLGEQGFDGHPDHIATHTSARFAQWLLRDDHPLTLWALTIHGEHSHAQYNSRHVPKLAALALHGSQMPLKRTFSGDLAVTDYSHWQTFTAVYGKVLYGTEKYQMLR